MSGDQTLRLLLRAILEEPSCDLHRLAYADRCEELGDYARAEFIRAQCELAKPCPLGYSDARHVDDECPACDPLSRRERSLLASHAETWAMTGLDDVHWGDTSYATGVFLHRWDDPRHGPIADMAVTFRRGFVEEVSLTIASFLRRATALFAAHPITSVRLTDREPYDHAGRAHWWYDSRSLNATAWWGSLHRLPGGLFQGLAQGLAQGEDEGAIVSYRSLDDAIAALSLACVDHGRRLAGLPMLLSTTLSPKDDTEGGKV